MRIAHLDSGRTWRGGQAQVLLLLDRLRARGHDSLLAAPEGPLLERARAAGHETRSITRWAEIDLGAGRSASGRLRSFAPDLLHAHTAHAHAVAVGAGRALDVPVVVSRRVLGPVGRTPFSRWKYRSGVARYLCVSRAVAASLSTSGVAPSLIAVVPSAVDTRVLSEVRSRVDRGEAPESLRASLGMPAGASLVGTAAALTREKGAPLLIEAARRVSERRPDARFVWIGDGPARAEATRAIEQAGLEERFHLLGFRPDVLELMAQLTLFVSASSSEGLGTAVLEAQALGVPVVVTDSGGVRDSVEDDVSGRIVVAERLAQAIAEAIDDEESRRRWREAGLVSVRRFSPENLVARTLEEYARARGAAASTAAS